MGDRDQSDVHNEFQLGLCRETLSQEIKKKILKNTLKFLFCAFLQMWVICQDTHIEVKEQLKAIPSTMWVTTTIERKLLEFGAGASIL